MAIVNLFSVGEIKAVYTPQIKPTQKLMSSRHAYEILLPLWEDINYCESFMLLQLSNSNMVIGISRISTGGLTGTVADPKKIFQHALLGNAGAIIIAHNHPSGNTVPSARDRELTNKIKEAGKALDMPLLDHLIITDEKYFSFADEGVL